MMFILFCLSESDCEGNTILDANRTQAMSGVCPRIIIKRSIRFHVSILYNSLTSFQWCESVYLEKTDFFYIAGISKLIYTENQYLRIRSDHSFSQKNRTLEVFSRNPWKIENQSTDVDSRIPDVDNS